MRPVEGRILAQRAEAMVWQGTGFVRPAGFTSHAQQEVLDDVQHLGPGMPKRSGPVSARPLFLSTGSYEVHQVGYQRIPTLNRAITHSRKV